METIVFINIFVFKINVLFLNKNWVKSDYYYTVITFMYDNVSYQQKLFSLENYFFHKNII